MREILFRGQTRRKGQKVWMDGTPVDSKWVEGYGVCMGKGDFSVIYSGDHIEKFVVYTDTVGQFTGLTDKNGKKIFEGDICRVCLDPEVCIGDVIWDGEIASYNIPLDNGKCVLPLDIFIAKNKVGDKVWIEVIGNIHDNPELLED